MTRKTLPSIVLAAASALLAACGDDTTASTAAGPTGTPTTSATSSGSGGSGGEAGSGGAGGEAGSGGAGGNGGAGGGGAVCGNGALEGTETCDDGNTAVGDGCDDACLLEAGYTCAGAPSVCDTTCGDGVPAGTEECDDSNTAPLDGCDDACLIETGYTCAGQPSACDTTCGDGVPAGAEECDDSNTAPLDGCDDACLIEAGYTCAGEPSACDTTCGDGLVLGDEACDDGDTDPLDGCSDLCIVEAGYMCAGEPSACDTTCGDGVVAGAEQCDDSDTSSFDGCSGVCLVEAGYTCAGMPSACNTTCGDGVRAGLEQCDDGDTDPLDGCSDACVVEPGFTCAGIPSVCLAICGDGIVTPIEGCDDFNGISGDGCSSCEPDLGYICAGQPSTCSTVCGDGIVAGTEECDDGNPTNGDGCSITCTENRGESCADPLLMSQATVAGGLYTWVIPEGSVTTPEGTFDCDDSGSGTDAVIRYTKTSPDLANGGNLLHVKADTAETATNFHLNLEIVGGACNTPAGTVLKCLWVKHDWDSFLDVPAGDYYIWVAKNVPANPFPETTVTIEEIPADDAEGEGCFAPYTSASANYTPPAGPGLPHTWILPASINSFDMGVTWGEPGSISCDDTAPYGDIHGVDAVIAYDKASATSVLKVDVQNLDPVLSTSDLNVEILSGCDPNLPGTFSRKCAANLDTITLSTSAPVGTAYIWVSTEATSEEFDGASVQVIEVFPGLGESWPTAEPLTMSGPINKTSTLRLDPPSCFPATGNIHWYSYTAINDVIAVSANAPGNLGFVDAAGLPLGCTPNAQAAPVGMFTSPGTVVYVAVEVAGPITALTITDVVYTGLDGNLTDLMVTFPSIATTEFGMAVSASEIFLGGTGKVFSMPKAGQTMAVEHGPTQGIPLTVLGNDLTFGGGALFSVDPTTVVGTSRLFSIYNEATATWAPTTWDLAPAYPVGSAMFSIAYDGTSIIMATRNTTANVAFYSFPSGMAAAPVALGTNTNVDSVSGLAADDQYFYVVGTGNNGEGSGVFRVSRAAIAGPVTKLATVLLSTTKNNIDVDAHVNPQNLYVRSSNGDIHVIARPNQADFVHLGPISTLGTTSDFGMVFDKTSGALFFFDTESNATGSIIRMQ